MPIDGLAERLIRMAKQTPYHLERTQPDSLDDALLWLEQWYAENGMRIWLNIEPSKRAEMVKCWLWLRWLHKIEWRARGGLDVG